jgi:hypothetical protein
VFVPLRCRAERYIVNAMLREHFFGTRPSNDYFSLLGNEQQFGNQHYSFQNYQRKKSKHQKADREKK